MNKWNRIVNRVKRLFLRSIPVFVFHHVSDTRDPLICAESDWTQIDEFKRNILHLKQHYSFISLQDAIFHLQYDKIRIKRYAVLTADDGLRSTYELLPWLDLQKIPITLFICPKYLDGHSYVPKDEQRVHRQYPDVNMNEVASRMFITPMQLQSINSQLVTIASHGFAHLDASTISKPTFELDIEEAKRILEMHPLYRPFFAYPWGHRAYCHDELLKQKGLIPILCDGNTNYYWKGIVSRICIDNTCMYNL